MLKNIKLLSTISVAFIFMICFTSAKKTPALKDENPPKIQVAILLDVSSSMDGLIEQAKAQLWNMVNTLGKVTCKEKNPEIEIALYEYGRSNNELSKGYVKQINGFINNLDSLSENLFTLKTNGGEEYCGQVIYTALNELIWDGNSSNYKVIFICGNEDFLQGNLKYTQACSLAKDKGVVVNTIYCGSKDQGIKEHWDLSTTCGNGSYSFINTNASIDEIATPYDSMLISMNNNLNATYLTYGWQGLRGKKKQMGMDEVVVIQNKAVAMKRINAKANKAAYKNTSWDLVDAYNADSTILLKLDRTPLADSLKTKTSAEIKAIVLAKNNERNAAQKEIAGLYAKRNAFIAEEKKKKADAQVDQNLETEIEKIIKEQVQRYNMVIK